jgi:excisionase family DNA binding protein
MTRRTSNFARNSVLASRVGGLALGARPVTKLRKIGETADILNVSERTVRRLIDMGALPAHRLGRSVRISDADIAVFLAANRNV